MKWKFLLATTFLAGAGPAAAFFFQAAVNGPSALPPGVTLLNIDGGATYFGDHTLSNATASTTWNPSALGSQPTVVYTNGWDDPKWFQYGPALDYIRNSSDVTSWISLGFNAGIGLAAPTTGQMALLRGGGLQNITWGQYLGNLQTVDTLGAETAGIFLWDEPQFSEQITAQIQGYSSTTFTVTTSGANWNVSTTPTGGVPILGAFWQYAGSANGSCSSGPCMVNTAFVSGSGITANTFYLCTSNGFAGSYQICSNGGGTSLTITNPTTVTQIAYPGYNMATGDGRIYSVGLASLTAFFNNTINSASGNISLSSFFSAPFTAPSGKARQLDFIGGDVYHFLIGRACTPTGSPCILSGNNNQSLSNMYDFPTHGASAMTMAQASNGAHYGDLIDFYRMNDTNSVPIYSFIETGNCKCNIANYVIQPVEMAWGVWSSIIHGARGIAWFDNDDNLSPQFTGPANIYSPYYQNPRSVTLTGSISSGTLTATTSATDTVPGQTQFNWGPLAPGMVCTSGCTGSPQVAQQLTIPTPATFTAVFSGVSQTTLTVSGVTGTVVVPSVLTGTGVSGQGSGNLYIEIQAGTGPTYTVFQNAASPSGTTTATPAYGGQGTYKLSGATNQGSATLTFQQQFGRGNNTPAAMSMTGMLTELAKEIRDVAPVINSKFAAGYISVNLPGYRFEDNPTNQTCSAGSHLAIQSIAFATCTGIEVMAKYYQGGSYPASTGETISPGFYVFAGTRYPSTNISADIGTVTYTLGTSGCNGASVATVIGESRTRTITACQFTDTFNNAWTYHIYKIQ